MKLVIGGYAQGKLKAVLQKEHAEACTVFEGRLPDEKERQEALAQGKKIIINHLHIWVKESLAGGRKPEEELGIFLKENPSCILLCDEIGNGIVPIDPFEREYRERTGRILIGLAGNAEEVVRVLCGIGQKIK